MSRLLLAIAVLFLHLSVALSCTVYSPSQTESSFLTCSAWGDPHFTSLSGAQYSSQCYGEQITFEHIPTCLTIEANHTQWASVTYPVTVQDKFWIYSSESAACVAGLCGVIDEIETNGANLIIDGTSYAFTQFSASARQFTGFSVTASSSTSVDITFDATGIVAGLTWFPGTGSNYYNLLLQVPSAVVSSASDMSGLCVDPPSSCTSDAAHSSPCWCGAIEEQTGINACAALSSNAANYAACLLDIQSTNVAAAATAAVQAAAAYKAATCGCSCSAANLAAITTALAAAELSCAVSTGLCVGTSCQADINTLQAAIGAALECIHADISLQVSALACVTTGVSCLNLGGLLGGGL